MRSQAQQMLALLVDPHEDTRALYGEFLRILDWCTDEAADGRDALAKALSTHPDAIVSETRLPGISGLDLCRLVRSDPELAATPVVFVTAMGSPADIAGARAAGADAVLVKPCPPADLGRTLAQLVEESRRAIGQLSASAREVRDLIERSRGQLDEAERAMRAAPRAVRKLRPDIPLIAPRDDLACPLCGKPLRYVRSFVGGVSDAHREQWDYFDCPAGCGEYQYRVRTRKLRRVQKS